MHIKLRMSKGKDVACFLSDRDHVSIVCPLKEELGGSKEVQYNQQWL